MIRACVPLLAICLLAGCARRSTEVLRRDEKIVELFAQRPDAARADLEGFVFAARDTLATLRQKRNSPATISLYAKAASLAARLVAKDAPVCDEELRQFVKTVSQLGLGRPPARGPAAQPVETLKTSAPAPDQWIDDLITELRAPKTETPGLKSAPRGLKPAGREIGLAAAQFIILNRYMILQMGRAGFEEFLLLLSRGQKSEALDALYRRIETPALVIALQENATELAEFYRQEQEFRAFLIQASETLGGTAASVILKHFFTRGG